MSDVQKNIISRRTVYKFDQREVPATVLEIAFEAARHAPNHKHTHPWKFYVLGQEARSSILPEVKRLAELKSMRLGRSSSDEGMKKAIAKRQLVHTCMHVCMNLLRDFQAPVYAYIAVAS